MSSIPDITPSEEWVVKTSLKERYQRDIELQYADSEIRVSASDRELTPCPVIFWQVGDCNFVIFKTGERHYRCQFFYKPYRQFGTGVREYDDLTECTISLLQAQADQLAEERGELDVKGR